MKYVIVTTAVDGTVNVWGTPGGSPFTSLKNARHNLYRFAWADSALVHAIRSL